MSADKDYKLEPQMAKLKTRVEAAAKEMLNAVQFYEVWHPASHDKNLHERLDNSYAANAFLIVRNALWREMVLSLVKIWDTHGQTISMESIHRTLEDKRIQRLLIKAVQSKKKWEPSIDGIPGSGTNDAMRQADLDDIASDVDGEIKDCIKRMKEYLSGDKNDVLCEMKRIRDKHLAHHQLKISAVRHVKQEDFADLLENFYSDTRVLVENLYALVHRISRDFQDDGYIAARYSAMFWGGVAGEKHANHPGYTPPPQRRGRNTFELFSQQDDGEDE